MHSRDTHVKAALTSLSSVEWLHPQYGDGHCPSCEGARSLGHQTGCAIQTTIRELSAALLEPARESAAA